MAALNLNVVAPPIWRCLRKDACCNGGVDKAASCSLCTSMLNERLKTATLGFAIDLASAFGPSMTKRLERGIRPIHPFPEAVADPHKDRRLPFQPEINFDHLVHSIPHVDIGSRRPIRACADIIGAPSAAAPVPIRAA
ncbi:hypothetical protein FHT72_006580 [Rhizobium sp. BK077]|nr:hypothetical protein [Rhizobium sp. BK112]MBB3372047.1 hypothetical protein [Rhizobium sp. BK077]